jgi:MFS family permease
VSAIPEESEYKVYGYRWVVTAVFGLVLLVQAFLWLSFTPIGTSVETALGVSNVQVRLLALVGPFMFILVGSYAGSLGDNRGWKFSAGVGTVMLVIAGIVKAVTPYVIDSGTAQWWIYLLMQILGGTGAAFALANLSKMPIKWFPEKQRALGNGLTTMSMYLGTAIGLTLVTAIAGIPERYSKVVLTTPRAIEVTQNGLNSVLLVMGIIMAVTGVLFFVFAKEEPPTPAGPVEEQVIVPLREAFGTLFRSATFKALCIVSLAGYGVYIGVTVTMEKMMQYHGFNASFAASVAAGITVGGIVGAGLIPPYSEKVGLRKPFLILAGSVAVPALLIIAFVGNKPLDIALGILMGFFLLPALPVTFTIVGEMEEIGPKLAATGVGTLLAVGSIGSAGVPLLMDIFARKVGGLTDYRWAILFLAALAIVAVVGVIFFVRETGPKRKEAKKAA